MSGPLPAKEPVGFRSVAHVTIGVDDEPESKRKVRRRVRRVARQQVKRETTEAR